MPGEGQYLEMNSAGQISPFYGFKPDSWRATKTWTENFGYKSSTVLKNQRSGQLQLPKNDWGNPKKETESQEEESQKSVHIMP